MTIALTKVQIISNAIAIMGKGIILSLDSQNSLVNAAEQAFDSLLASVLSKGFWRFATKLQVLPQLVTPPIVSDWQYAYSLPGDYLKLIRLFPQNYAFEIFAGGLLFSNVNGLVIEYQYLVEPTALPPYFNEYFFTYIAAYLAKANAQSSGLSKVLTDEAAILYSQALAADSQNRPQTPIMSRPVITNRFVGTYIYG